VLQVLDPAELTLEFGRKGIWHDVEDGSERYVDPDQARSGYLERFNAHQAEVKRALESRGVIHQVVSTSEPLDFVLLELLRRGRMGSLAGRRRAQR
jgi:hypothetical protein